MSEAELHVLRARLNGGIRNKAARGELRRGLPVRLRLGRRRWRGPAPGRSRPHRYTPSLRPLRRDRLGPACCGLWFRSEELTFPLQMHQGGEIRWVEPSCTAIHHVLTNPVYAGAYANGRTRQEIVLDAAGRRKKRLRHLPRTEWQVLIPQHHPGFIDWQTYEANQQRLARNTRPGPHKAGGAVREGAALLQGLARCGHCGRRLHTHYRGRNAAPGTIAPARFLSKAAAPIASISAASDRCGRHRGLHRRPGTGRACRHPCRRRTARTRSRGRFEAMAARRRAGRLPGPELVGIRPGAAAAGGLDGLGHARGDRGLVPAPHGSARSAAGLLGRGDRDRAPGAPGLRPAVAADRRPAALDHRLARPG